jgi:N-acetylglucosamine-6-phosphate deacetylase
MNGMLKIYNGRVLTPHRLIPLGTVVIKGERIVEVSEGNVEVPDAIEIDAQGRYIAPGFIDIHVHGGGGYDFMDGSPTAFLKVAELHARYGTTSMTPTTLSSDKAGILQTLQAYEAADGLNTRYIRNPDPEEYKDIISRSSVIKRWSAAPELPGALEFGRYLRSQGILAAVAHTDAIYEEVEEAFENGYSLITHLYSGMSGVTRRNAFRYAGVVESAWLIDEMDVEIIADGIHLPPPLLKLAYKIKGAGKLALITDAMRAAGMPPGESVLGSLENGLKVIVEDGVAKLPDRSAFAGSVATADRLVRNMITLAGIPLPEAVRMITSTPAEIMKAGDRKGSLVRGKDADIVLFDDDVTVTMTIIKGKIVYPGDQ